MATLDQQLLDLAEKHNLTHVSIELFTLEDGTRFFGASAHGGGIAANNGTGTSQSTSACIEAAIRNLNDLRTASVAVPVLEALEVAA